jgi:hypothetical protein
VVCVGQQCYLFIRGCASNCFAFLVVSYTINVPAHLRSFYSQVRSYIYIYKYTCIHVHNVHYSVTVFTFLVNNKFVHLYSTAVLLCLVSHSGYLSLIRTLNLDCTVEPLLLGLRLTMPLSARVGSER